MLHRDQAAIEANATAVLPIPDGFFDRTFNGRDLPIQFTGRHLRGRARLLALADEIERLDPRRYDQNTFVAATFINARTGIVARLFPKMEESYTFCALGYSGDHDLAIKLGRDQFWDTIGALYDLPAVQAGLLFGTPFQFAELEGYDGPVTPKRWAAAARRLV